ncbi:hypothetical protein Ngar_c15590 [Candidatus Nitrososphaera gargensis Ga9.2]|uniref:Transposase n=1 Tax=Nitrososphaera gargensis (strain Ga9.2) TaxID=1237085 RepID=K0IHR9_NITGG|nr:hypothetical protein [Candidatus Nitrososphaera gargensis]AFU58493.1 hypothetical protein Ngar_c15590 [Candidatus Nitrososphaera gargensis Ga9.2]
MSTTFFSYDRYRTLLLDFVLTGQFHSHQCPKCGVVYDCDQHGCLKFQRGCDR